MRKQLSMLLAVLLLIMTPLQVMAAPGEYPDMPNDWSTAAVKSAVENGLLRGYDGYIHPDKSLTRAEMATVINRAFGSINTESLSGFTDVKATDWFSEELEKAVAMGTFEGSNNRLRPNDSITREEAFVVISRAFNLSASATTKSFEDLNTVSEWSKEGIYALINAGYVNGSNGRLNLKDNISRAEFAQLMYNIVGSYIGTSGTYQRVRSGNVVVSAPDTVLKGVEITGDLIIADGVGSGEVTLEDVVVTGRVLVRAGGENSVIIRGSSQVDNLEVVNRHNKVRIFNETDREIKNVVINSKVDTILEGKFENVEVKSNGAAINLKSATINKVDVTGESSTVNVDEKTNVEEMTVNAPTVKVEGKGRIAVVKVEAKGNNAQVLTPATKIMVSELVEKVTGTGGIEIKGNENFVNGDTETEAAKPVEEIAPTPTPTDPVYVPPSRYTLTYETEVENGLLESETESGTSLVSGAQVEFIATADEGYGIKDWTVNGVSVGHREEILTVTVNRNIVVEVEFAPLYVVEFSSIGEGHVIAFVDEIEIESGDLVLEGSRVEFFAGVGPGFMLKSWTINEIELEQLTSPIAIPELSFDVIVVAEFEEVVMELVDVEIFVTPIDVLVVLMDAEENVIEGVDGVYQLMPGFYSLVVSAEGYHTFDEMIGITEATQIFIDLEEIKHDIVSVEEFPILELPAGEELPVLPSTVAVVLDNEEVVDLEVIWDTSTYGPEASNYVFYGELVLVDNITNTTEIKAEYLVDTYAAPVITVEVTNTSMLLIDSDQPLFIDGQAVVDYGVLEFLQLLFNDPTLDATIMNEDKIVIHAQPFEDPEHPWMIKVELLNDAINRDLFYALDHPDGGFVGNGDGIYRKDVSVDLSIFENLHGQASESVTEDFKLKFSVPLINGVAAYDFSITGIFQTEAQRAEDIDPVRDTTAPELIDVAFAIIGDSFTLMVAASDEYLYELEVDHSLEAILPEFSVYASEETPYGSEENRLAFEANGIDITYVDGGWTINFGSTVSAIMADAEEVTFYFVVRDFAGNEWGSMMPPTVENTYTFSTIVEAPAPDSYLIKTDELVETDGVYSTTFSWGSVNGIGSINEEISGTYGYYDDGAYLRFQVKDATNTAVKFIDVFQTFDDGNNAFGGMTLQTNGGNINDMDGSNRERADWGVEGLDGFATNLPSDGTYVFYGVIQNATVGTKTVGFNAEDLRTVDMTLMPLETLAPGTYTVVVEVVQQGGDVLAAPIEYTFTIN